jgi:hypothetical protein
MENSYFPELYPDELLYSACARYQSNIGSHAQKAHIEKLFDLRSCCAIADLPSHLSTLVSKLPNSNNTLGTIIFNHTNYPYYRPFLPEVVAQKAMQYMASNDEGGKIHMSLGITASTVPRPRYLRFCKECVADDLNTYGTTYWRRVHQLPAVCICPIHSSPLTSSGILVSTLRGKHYFADLNTVYRSLSNEVAQDFEIERMLDVAKRSFELLKTRYDDLINKDILKELYITELDRKGYVTASGRIRFKKLIVDFTAFHSYTFLKSINCNIQEGSEDTWLHKALRNSTENCHPLRHILMLIFLGKTLTNILKPERQKPFGNAPWPCLNRAASHFKEPVVNECIVTVGSKTKKPTGHFICDCGFAYIRTGPDTSVDDRFRIGRIQSFGPIWLKEARKLSSNQNLTTREKARKLGVDPKTLIRRAQNNVEQVSNVKTPVKRRIARNRRKKAPTTKRVNWLERDREMCSKVLSTVEHLLAEEKPRRITKSELIRRGNLHSSIVYYPEKLPKTSLLIGRYVENVEAFQIRRIDWAIDQLTTSNELMEWRVRRLASITHKCCVKVQKYLEHRIG